MGINIKTKSSLHTYRLHEHPSSAEFTTAWGKFPKNNYGGSYVWTDGTNIYYSWGDDQYRWLGGQTWEEMVWQNKPRFLNGEYIWSDGVDTYCTYPGGTNVAGYTYKLSGTSWVDVTDQLGSFNPREIWTDGTHIFKSYYDNPYSGLLGPYFGHYVLKDGTWQSVTDEWTLDEALDGKLYVSGNNIDDTGVWTDGTTIYGGTRYVLENGVWKNKTWGTLPTYFHPNSVWTDGKNTYYSYNASEQIQYILKDGNWEKFTWTPYNNSSTNTYPVGYNLWTDGHNITGNVTLKTTEDKVVDIGITPTKVSLARGESCTFTVKLDVHGPYASSVYFSNVHKRYTGVDTGTTMQSSGNSCTVTIGENEWQSGWTLMARSDDNPDGGYWCAYARIEVTDPVPSSGTGSSGSAGTSPDKEYGYNVEPPPVDSTITSVTASSTSLEVYQGDSSPLTATIEGTGDFDPDILYLLIGAQSANTYYDPSAGVIHVGFDEPEHSVIQILFYSEQDYTKQAMVNITALKYYDYHYKGQLPVKWNCLNAMINRPAATAYGAGATLRWDGNIEGKVSIEGYLYKITDRIFDAQELTGCSQYANGWELIGSNMQPIEGDGCVYCGSLVSGKAGGNLFDVLTIPEDGTYFAYSVEDSVIEYLYYVNMPNAKGPVGYKISDYCQSIDTLEGTPYTFTLEGESNTGTLSSKGDGAVMSQEDRYIYGIMDALIVCHAEDYSLAGGMVYFPEPGMYLTAETVGQDIQFVIGEDNTTTDTKPFYKHSNGKWVKKTAFQCQSNRWVKISSEDTTVVGPIGKETYDERGLTISWNGIIDGAIFAVDKYTDSNGAVTETPIGPLLSTKLFSKSELIGGSVLFSDGTSVPLTEDSIVEIPGDSGVAGLIAGDMVLIAPQGEVPMGESEVLDISVGGIYFATISPMVPVSITIPNITKE